MKHPSVGDQVRAAFLRHFRWGTITRINGDLITISFDYQGNPARTSDDPKGMVIRGTKTTRSSSLTAPWSGWGTELHGKNPTQP